MSVCVYDRYDHCLIAASFRRNSPTKPYVNKKSASFFPVGLYLSLARGAAANWI